MKKLISGILAILIAVSLAACSSAEEEVPPTPQDSNYWALTEHQHVLDSGHEITCITYKNNYAGGVSCDWGRVR